MNRDAAFSPLIAGRERRNIVVQLEGREAEQWVGQPWWVIARAQLGVLLGYGAIIAAETPLMVSALKVFVADVDARMLQPMAVGILIGYAIVWHTVGERLSRGEFVALRSDPATGRAWGNPGFGLAGWLYAVFGIATAVTVAYLRADAAATLFAEDAERRAGLGVPLEGSPGVERSVYNAAFTEKLFTEIIANAALMGLMALAAMAMARRWQALAVVGRLRRLAAAADRAAKRADDAESDAEADRIHVDRLESGLTAQSAASIAVRDAIDVSHSRALWAAGMELALVDGSSTSLVVQPNSDRASHLSPARPDDTSDIGCES